MKKVIIGITLFACVLYLMACSKKAANSSTSTGSTNSLSTEAELAVGTFKLEGTDFAVTAGQAKQLLPLWQTLAKISSSSTTATEEMNALVSQIKSAMTADQIDAITAMKLTQADMMTAMVDAGVGMGGTNGTPNPNATPNMQSFAGGPNEAGPSFSTNGGGAPPSGGNMPSGGPSGGQMPGGGGVVVQGGPEMGGGPSGISGTPQAVRGNDFANLVPPPLLNALIEMLQKKIQ